MSIPVIVKNIVLSVSGPSSAVFQWKMGDWFLSERSYQGPAEHHLTPMIYDGIEEELGEEPNRFEWCYLWDQNTWFEFEVHEDYL